MGDRRRAVAKHRRAIAMSESESNELAAALASDEYEYVDVDELNEHPKNEKVYGELDPDESFIEDIRRNGIETPLVVNQHENTQTEWGLDNTVIGGHRRLMAAKEVGINKVPVRWQEYPEPMATRRLVKNNNQREKTPGQQAREMFLLEETERQVGKEHMSGGGEGSQNSANPNFDMYEEIGEEIGVSHDTVKKATDVYRFAYPDEYLHDDLRNKLKYNVDKKVREVAKHQVERMDAGEQSFHGGHVAVKTANKIMDMAKSANVDISDAVDDAFDELKKGDVKPEVVLEEVKTTKHKLESQRQSEKKRQKFAEENNENLPYTITEGDFTDVLPNVDKTVDHIITDPPYGEDAMETWADLARIAADVLEPSGLLVAYSGKHHLPIVINALEKHLEYFWQGVVIHKGAGARIWPRNIRTNYKPILIYQKPPVQKLPNLTDDVIKGGGAEKDDHEWQQATAEAVELVEKFTEPNDHIVDPMCGSGTTGVAALTSDRRVTLIDRDSEAVATAKRRCADAL